MSRRSHPLFRVADCPLLAHQGGSVRHLATVRRKGLVYDRFCCQPSLDHRHLFQVKATVARPPSAPTLRRRVRRAASRVVERQTS